MRSVMLSIRSLYCILNVFQNASMSFTTILSLFSTFPDSWVHNFFQHISTFNIFTCPGGPFLHSSRSFPCACASLYGFRRGLGSFRLHILQRSDGLSILHEHLSQRIISTYNLNLSQTISTYLKLSHRINSGIFRNS